MSKKHIIAKAQKKKKRNKQKYFQREQIRIEKLKERKKQEERVKAVK